MIEPQKGFWDIPSRFGVKFKLLFKTDNCCVDVRLATLAPQEYKHVRIRNSTKRRKKQNFNFVLILFFNMHPSLEP